MIQELLLILICLLVVRTRNEVRELRSRVAKKDDCIRNQAVTIRLLRMQIKKLEAMQPAETDNWEWPETIE